MLKTHLPVHEQSFLLSTLLMAPNNVEEILSIRTKEQQEQLRPVLEKFMTSPKDVRLNQIVRELRRLLMIDEFDIRPIHQSWIEQALLNEPIYLRAIIEQAILDRTKKQLKTHTLVYAYFVKQFDLNRPSFYDQVILSLQAAKIDVEGFLSKVGRFIAKDLCLPPDIDAQVALKAFAIYLLAHKDWQASIILSLPRPIGIALKQHIEEAQTTDEETKSAIIKALISALENS